jgi:hypothetical protein
MRLGLAAVALTLIGAYSAIHQSVTARTRATR